MDWLEPAIEKRSIDIFDQILGDENYTRFMETVKSLVLVAPGTPKHLLFELENIFILKTRQAVDYSYRAGFLEGCNLKR